MIHDIERVLFSAEQIQVRIRTLGEELYRDYAGLNPLFIGVLKGAFIFMADLLRATQIPCALAFVTASSYGTGANSTGEVQLAADNLDVENRHIILIEDILDSGHTLSALLQHVQGKNPASVKICTLLDKPERRQTSVSADYLGFTIENEFVVGYGLDYSEKYRNLPFIGVLKREIYE